MKARQGSEITTNIADTSLHIEAKDFSVYAANGEQLLDDVNVDINQGEFVSIIGQSGAGKTLLATALAGLHGGVRRQLFRSSNGMRYEGSITYTQSRFNGFYNRRLPPGYPVRRELIGYVPQAQILDDGMTVIDSILSSSRLKQQHVDEKRLEEVTKQLGIAQLLSKKAMFLSGGQKQRVAIARGFAHSPRAVILDEPTAALNEELKEETNVMLRNIVESTGTTVITVTHDATLATRCIEMANGRKIYDGPSIDYDSAQR